MNLETFMTENFSDHAKEVETQMKGKQYTYALSNASENYKVYKQGICKVIERHYNRSLDCDIITIEDITTGEQFTKNQFEINLRFTDEV